MRGWKAVWAHLSNLLLVMEGRGWAWQCPLSSSNPWILCSCYSLKPEMDPLNNKCECAGSKLLIRNSDVYWGQTHVALAEWFSWDWRNIAQEWCDLTTSYLFFTTFHFHTIINKRDERRMRYVLVFRIRIRFYSYTCIYKEYSISQKSATVLQRVSVSDKIVSMRLYCVIFSGERKSLKA